jgi:hypothetical protein
MLRKSEFLYLPSCQFIVFHVLIAPEAVKWTDRRERRGKDPGRPRWSWNIYLLLAIDVYISKSLLTYSIIYHLVSCLRHLAMVHLETTTSSPSAMSSSNHGYGRGEEQLAVAKTILAQAIDLVDKHLTSDEQLIVSSKYLPGSTIGKMKSSLSSEFSCLPSVFSGKHLRHARDHFVLLADCMLSPAPRLLSYDTRIRNTPMETSLDGARKALRETINQLENVIPTVDFDEEITLQAVTPHLHSFKTTLGREVGPTLL